MRSKHYILIFLALLPIILFRDFTPNNELRYLSIADEALREGHLFVFTNHGIVYADKPPLYLWIVMLGKFLLGAHCMWFLALFSVIPAFVILFVMDKWTVREIDKRYRLVASFLLMTSVYFLGGALTLRMDMMMCMFIILALHTFYKMYEGKGTTLDSWLFPFYIFMSVFTKGPIGILVPLLSTLVFLGIKKELRTVGKYWGLKTFSFLIFCCAIWFIAVWIEGGSSYLNNLLFHQTIDRAVNSFHHEAPFYYYFLSVWYSLAPWSLFFIFLIVTGIHRGLLQTDLEKFFLTVIVTTFVMLSLISSKIEIYLLPAFPFFAYLSILFLMKIRWNCWIGTTMMIPCILFTFTFPAFCLLYFTKFFICGYETAIFIGVTAAAFTISGIFALIYLYRYRNICVASHFIVGGLLLALFTMGWDVSAFNDKIGYRELCKKGAELATERKITRYCVYKITRGENMDVYLHQPIQNVSAEDILSNRYFGSLLFVNIEELNKSGQLKSFFKLKTYFTIGEYALVFL